MTQRVECIDLTNFPERNWLDEFTEKVNSDPEMNVIGDSFSLKFTIATEIERFLFSIKEGKIQSIEREPNFDARSSFGLRAPLVVWKKFISSEPEPFYHDFFAMLMRVPEFIMDGDSMIAMQNARALHRFMNLMK